MGFKEKLLGVATLNLALLYPADLSLGIPASSTTHSYTIEATLAEGRGQGTIQFRGGLEGRFGKLPLEILYEYDEQQQLEARLKVPLPALPDFHRVIRGQFYPAGNYHPAQPVTARLELNRTNGVRFDGTASLDSLRADIVYYEHEGAVKDVHFSRVKADGDTLRFNGVFCKTKRVEDCPYPFSR
jgi:hypothetical protein